MIRVHIDIETFSPVPLTKTGVYKYAEHPDTEILCIAYAFGPADIRIWKKGKPLHQLNDLIFAFKTPQDYELAAHNANFEMVMLNSHCGQDLNLPATTPDQWVCTAAKARNHNLPGSLEQCALELGLTEKDQTGKRVMLKLSQPRKPSKLNPATRWTPETAPEDFKILYDYCVTDVQVEREIDEALEDLTTDEREMYNLDQKINSLGVEVDVKTVAMVQKLYATYIDKLHSECVQLCGFAPTQRDKVQGWCRDHGVEIEGFTKSDVESALSNSLHANVRRVLEIRQAASQTAVKKYASLEIATCADNRLRGTLQYYGASQTGRWAGRIFQPQNIARGTLKDPDTAIELINQGDTDVLEMLYDDPIKTFAGCLRGMIKSPAGWLLLVSDYAGIEARVVQWLAGDEAALDTFRSGRDAYKDMAASIFGIKYEQVDKSARFVGKVAILGLGYGMGAKKFRETCASYGQDITGNLAYKTVNTYRKKFSDLVEYWGVCERAAKEAINTPGTTQSAGKSSFVFDGKFLSMILPNGRAIKYYKARIEASDKDKGWNAGPQIRYRGTNPQSKKPWWCDTYGGKLVENMTQAVARDLLAEAMKALDRNGRKIVLHVHDEIVVEADMNAKIEDLEREMCVLPAWAKGCPVEAEGFACLRYKK